MKVYVDRLPKCCEECPCCNNCMDYGCSCNLDDIKLTYDDYANKRNKDCPLQSIADYTKQVRKELIAKVYEVLEQAVPHDLCWSWAVIKKELDQIQGE